MNEGKTLFYPTIGWPAGRGAYDRLFKNFLGFRKINVNQFLFNFSSFLFGFNVPKAEDYGSRWRSGEFKKDIRDIIRSKIKQERRNTENNDGEIISGELNHFIEDSNILLDVGGNRIFNKIVHENKNLAELDSYEKYLKEYTDFIKISNPDIYVNFDIGPSYTSRVEISKEGRKAHSEMSREDKLSVYKDLTERSLNVKNEVGSKLMVPIGAESIEHFKQMLEYIYENFRKETDFIGIAGIAQKGRNHINTILKVTDSFVKEKDWNIGIHGLGLGGISKIPINIKYGLSSFDVGTPWRRACTDKTSQIYTPLLGGNLQFLDNQNPFKKVEITSNKIEQIQCSCPICQETPPSWMKSKFLEGSKHHSDKNKHGEALYAAQIKIYFHNVYQHVALTQILDEYKKNHGNDYLKSFLDDLSDGRGRSFNRFRKSIEAVA